MNIVIMGASSGFGMELASFYITNGHKVACASRRLVNIADADSQNYISASIDINSPGAPEQLQKLIAQLGGMDLYIHVSGIGYDNASLNPQREADIATTNCAGFSKMISTAFNWFAEHNQTGQIAAISSVAGTKAIANMEAYCASKRYDWTYLDGLRQRARINKLPITITDIRPGWTRTPLLKSNQSYPLLMNVQKASLLIIQAIKHKKKIAYINRRWHLLCLCWSITPDKLLQKIPTFRKFAP